MFSKLIWDEINIKFSNISPNIPENILWKIEWDEEEGTYERGLNYEIYLPTKYLAQKYNFYIN